MITKTAALPTNKTAVTARSRRFDSFSNSVPGWQPGRKELIHGVLTPSRAK
jgi:hypothetical protein